MATKFDKLRNKFFRVLSERFIIPYDEIKHIRRRKYDMKRRNAEKVGIQFRLTLVDYIQKMQEAGINADQINRSSSGFNLSRYHDEGDYTVENCRFVPFIVNQREKKLPLSEFNKTEKKRRQASEFAKTRVGDKSAYRIGMMRKLSAAQIN